MVLRAGVSLPTLAAVVVLLLAWRVSPSALARQESLASPQATVATADQDCISAAHGEAPCSSCLHAAALTHATACRGPFLVCQVPIPSFALASWGPPTLAEPPRKPLVPSLETPTF